MERIKELTEVDLRKELVNVGLPTGGTKGDLQNRLRKYLKENPNAVLLIERDNDEGGPQVSVDQDGVRKRKDTSNDKEKEKKEKEKDKKKPGVAFSEPAKGKKDKKEKEMEAYKDESSEGEEEIEVAQEISKEQQEFAKNGFATNIRENVKRFFKYNDKKLVRPKIQGN